MSINNPRGTSDILPAQISSWQEIETRARFLFSLYGYREIRTPLFEDTSLFKRSLGESTEVVNKQLLEVRSQKSESNDDASLSLRPEGTAPIVRAYNQQGLARQESLSKLFYMGPMFRGERPQKGRLRQFHQIGAEAIGYYGKNPLLDAEMIALAVNFLHDLGLEGFKLKVNSLGSKEDKLNFATWLRNALKDKVASLSEACQRQYEENVFRLLDSKDRDCQKVIESLGIGSAHLSEEGKKYFDEVLNALDLLGVEYEVSSQLVRGLDYYTHTVFEILYDGLGAQNAIGAGGRYNGLVEQLGGGDKRLEGEWGAIGFALGVERIMLALEDQGKILGKTPGIDAFVIHSGFETLAFELVTQLREAGISADMDFGGRNFKKQFEQANKVNAKLALILGEEEIQNGTVSVKDMASGEQRVVKLSGVVEDIKR